MLVNVHTHMDTHTHTRSRSQTPQYWHAAWEALGHFVNSVGSFFLFFFTFYYIFLFLRATHLYTHTHTHTHTSKAAMAVHCRWRFLDEDFCYQHLNLVLLFCDEESLGRWDLLFLLLFCLFVCLFTFFWFCFLDPDLALWFCLKTPPTPTSLPPSREVTTRHKLFNIPLFSGFSDIPE